MGNHPSQAKRTMDPRVTHLPTEPRTQTLTFLSHMTNKGTKPCFGPKPVRSGGFALEGYSDSCLRRLAVSGLAPSPPRPFLCPRAAAPTDRLAAELRVLGARRNHSIGNHSILPNEKQTSSLTCPLQASKWLACCWPPVKSTSWIA